MNRFQIAAVVLAGFAFATLTPGYCHAQDTGHLETQKLPVKRVVLYKNGIGYFEHTGRVRDNQELAIDFNTAQLNDVLKSLTLLDLNGGEISGVRYNSVAPLAEQLKSVHLPVGETPTLAAFLGAVRGARVEVHSGTGAATGRVLSVEQKQQRDKDTVTAESDLSLVTDAGEIRTFPLTAATSVRIADPDLEQELGRYLSLLNSVRDQDLRRMTIATTGSGERSIFVSYISEVPVWKSTYRIILPTESAGKPLLQGWAIVDNTVGEDWKDVNLSLVSGAPQSFIQDLSTPYYTRRPVVALPETAMLAPQTHEGTMEEKETTETEGEVSTVAAAPPQPVVAAISPGVVGGAGFGAGRARSLHGEAAQFDRLEQYSKLQSQQAQATTKDLGDLFEYDLKEKVTIAKNQSALVPIIHANIEADKVTLWSSTSSQPLRALWLKNTSGIDLDGGAFNIIDQNTFAGEGILDPVKPDERRLISYAVDQSVRVEDNSSVDEEPVTHVRVERGVLTLTSEEHGNAKYTIRNSDSQTRDVVIEHPVRDQWTLVGDSKPEETSKSFYRFRVKAAPKQTTDLKFEEVHPLYAAYELTNLTDDQVTLFLSARSIRPETEKALRSIVRQKNEIAGYERQIQDRKSKIDDITKDQQRLRENMKALKGSVEEKQLVLRYTRQLNSQEDAMLKLNAEIVALAQQRDKSRQALETIIAAMSIDEKL